MSTGETVGFSRKNDPLTFLKRAKELQEDLNNNIK